MYFVEQAAKQKKLPGDKLHPHTGKITFVKEKQATDKNKKTVHILDKSHSMSIMNAIRTVTKQRKTVKNQYQYVVGI